MSTVRVDPSATHRRKRAGREPGRPADVLVIGAGPAGLAAAACLARYGRRVLVLDSRPAGGQARRLGLVENYPGFPRGVSGAGLMRRFRAQARRWGAALISRDALKLARRGSRLTADTGSGSVEARAVILATGCGFRPLGLPRERSLSGVLHGGLAEARRLSGRVCVVGGGEAAAYQALAAATLASRVVLAVRGPSLKAHALLRRRLSEHPRIRVLSGLNPRTLLGRRRLTGVAFTTPLGGVRTVQADWLLVAVGMRPRTVLARRARGPGLFLAGDVNQGLDRQVAVAAGDGVRAAMACERFLNDERHQDS